MSAPKRIWARFTNWRNDYEGRCYKGATVDGTIPYILDTLEALAASPKVQALMREARAEGRLEGGSIAETIWLTAIETVDEALCQMGKHADPRLTAIDALKRRALKKGEGP